MSTFYFSAAHMNRRNNNLVSTYLVHKKTDSSNVSYRVKASNLMKMDLIYRNAMDIAFSLCNKSVYGKNIFFNFFRYIKMIFNDMLNICHTAVVMMMPVMMMVMIMVVVMFMVVMLVMVVIMIVVMVVVMMVVMIIMYVFAFFLLPVYKYAHMSTCNTAFNGKVRFVNDPGKVKCIKFF